MILERLAIMEWQGFHKGQLISEWLLDVLNFPRKTTLKFDEFLPWNLRKWLNQKDKDTLLHMLDSP